jgi:hypothetical protein
MSRMCLTQPPERLSPSYVHSMLIYELLPIVIRCPKNMNNLGFLKMDQEIGNGNSLDIS